MSQDRVKQSAESMAAETQRPEGAMATCPMANMCMGMMQRRLPSFLLMLPGISLIVVGVLIVIEPSILVWLMAAASVLLGIMLLMMAGFIRRMGTQLHT